MATGTSRKQKRWIYYLKYSKNFDIVKKDNQINFTVYFKQKGLV